MSDATKNDLAWEALFNKYRIIEHIEKKDYFEISATQINEFREARLMTKFDHKINLPRIFSHYGLSILPITRGSTSIQKTSQIQKNGHLQQIPIDHKATVLHVEKIV